MMMRFILVSSVVNWHKLSGIVMELDTYILEGKNCKATGKEVKEIGLISLLFKELAHVQRIK